MCWRNKKFTYDALIPPFDKPFENFTPEEAKKYFEWFTDQLNSRVEYLRSYSNIDLDYSVSSLVDVWDWFLNNAKIEKTPKSRLKQLDLELKNLPNEIRGEVLKEQSEQFTHETECIMLDIAMYFGEVYVRNNNSITWGYHTDIHLDSFANMPLLVGFEDRDFTPPFKTHFELSFTVKGLAYNIMDNDAKKEDLLEMYNKWQRMVFN